MLFQFLMALLFQAPAETGDSKTTIIRIVAAVLALACVVGIILRRKKKAAKEEW